MCEKLPDTIKKGVGYMVVNNTRKALGIFASKFYDHPSNKLKIIDVTGTNGKTSTAQMLYKSVSNMGYKAGLISTIYYKIADQCLPATLTTPDALELQRLFQLMVQAGCRYCFMEASSQAIIQERLSGTQLAGAVFTNITHEHLDYHKSFSGYIRAKKSFLTIYLLLPLPL